MHPTQNPPTTTTPAAEITPAVILRGAARYLELHGWHRGDAFQPDTGRPFPPACALGAIQAAVTGTANRVTSADIPAMCSAELVLAAHLDDDPDRLDTDPFELIGDWNDHADRTAAQVITALTEAADDWDRIHTGGTR